MSARVALAPPGPAHPTADAGRLLFVDGIRAYAIINVVLLHIAAPLVTRFPPLEPVSWWVANVVDSFARPCVPLFFMVSGLLLLDPTRQESTLVFFRKRFVRVMVPFLAWAAIYLAWRAVYHGEALALGAALRELFEGPIYVHFWFLYVLLGLYLVTPILRPYARQADSEQLLYFLLLWFATVSLLPSLNRFTGLQSALGLVVTTGFVGYPVLGHALRDVRLSGRGWMLALATLIALTAVTACGSYWLSLPSGTFDEFFYSNLSPNVIGMSICSFLLLRSLPWQRIASRAPAAQRIVSWLARMSFAIYLVHMIVLELLSGGALGFRLSASTGHPLLAIPAATGLVIAVSGAISAVLQRIPYVRRIVP
jgi:surface polysaccharide O-acyltransferase-like enzyme